MSEVCGLKRMDFRLIFAIVLVVNCGISMGEEKFGFPYTMFIDAIKETHVDNRTHMFLKASGCDHHKPIYTIKEEGTAFTIDPGNGQLFFEGQFNYDKVKSYIFTVAATANHRKCYAEIPVRIDVININKHRPEFIFLFDGKHQSSGQVKCQVDEETRHVKIHPHILVKDADTGPAGQIKNVNILESIKPFVVNLDKSTGEVLIAGDPDYDFDATRMSKYTFSLQAEDAGTIPLKRISKPLEVTCTVVAKNKYSPVFSKYRYIGRIMVGQTSTNIVKVNALDKDKNAKFGIICDYYIHKSSDVPFTIDNNGVISLKEPLGKDAKDNYVFVVMAKDCGGLESEGGALVEIIVDKDCTTDFFNVEKKTHKVKGCGGLIQLAPNIQLNKCGKSHQYEQYKSTIKMETMHILQGCDRETYEASRVFKMCNVNKTIDLLPSPEPGRQWTAPLSTKQDQKGENMYEFDGKTALNIPSNVLHYDSEDKLTISTWIWTELRKTRQYILASTDRQRLNRKHFALYTEGDQLIFIHRQEASSDSGVCPFRFTWLPDIFDISWHHIVITVAGCHHARLFIDGKQMATGKKQKHWPLHNSNMQTRFVVGAQWFGREQKYGDYFNGYLAGLSVNFGESVTEKAIHCVFECKEKIKIATPVPDGFKVEQHSHDEITIRGQGSAESFENLLRGLFYVNTRTHPTVGRRPLQIHTKVNNAVLPMISMEIMVESSVGDEKLQLSGAQKKLTTVEELNKYGIPVATMLTITATKCLQYVDEARVDIRPPLNTDESLINPGPLLSMYSLRKEDIENGQGVIIRGVATIEQYERVLRDLVFVNMAPQTGIRHTFKFTVSNINNGVVSNILETEIKITSSASPVNNMQTIDREQKDALPGAILDDEDFDEDEKRSGPGFIFIIGLIISCASMSVFTIIVIVACRNSRNRGFYTDVPHNETDAPKKQQEESVLNVTMNPLEKFEEAEPKDQEEPSKEAKTDKMNLEWDDAYIA